MQNRSTVWVLEIGLGKVTVLQTKIYVVKWLFRRCPSKYIEDVLQNRCCNISRKTPVLQSLLRLTIRPATLFKRDSGNAGKSYMIMWRFPFFPISSKYKITITITFRWIIQFFLLLKADIKYWCLTRLLFKNGQNFFNAGCFVYFFFLKERPLDYICI